MLVLVCFVFCDSVGVFNSGSAAVSASSIVAMERSTDLLRTVSEDLVTPFIAVAEFSEVSDFVKGRCPVRVASTLMV